MEALSSGRAAWAQVVGEPGIGKSRLLAEVCEMAESRRALVLAGRGTELESDVPYGVIVDALDDYLGSLEEGEINSLCGGRPGLLASVFPALAPLASPEAGGFQDERYRSHRAVRALLERLSATRAVVISLDDLHWADPASLELISHLLSHPPAGPLLLLLAWRARQAPRLGSMLAAGRGDLPGVELALGPLSRGELTELLAPDLDAATLAAVHHDSGGNPFYAQHLARRAAGAAEIEGAAARTPAWKASDVPRAVAASVVADIERLGVEALRVAQAASVVGEPFEPDIVASCAEVHDAEALAAIDLLERAGIVRPGDSPRRFLFRHPIVRRAVYDSVAPVWRLTAHAHMATLLGERRAPLVARAHHVAASARFGDSAAIDLLAAAAGQVQSQAPVTAVEWLTTALELLPPSTDSAPRRVDLLTARSAACGAVGNLVAAHASLEEALALVPEGGAEWVRLLARCVAEEHALGQWQVARDRLFTAMGHLPGAKSAERAALSVEVALSCLFWMDYDEASAWAARAAAIAAQADQVLQAAATGLLAFMHATVEEPKEARRRTDEAVGLLAGSAPSEIASPADASYYLGRAEYLLEDYPAAAAHLGRAAGLARHDRAVSRLVATTVEIEQSRALAACGRLEEAVEIAEAVVGTCRLSDYTWPLLLALAAQATVLGAVGDLDGATAAAREALSVDSARCQRIRAGRAPAAGPSPPRARRRRGLPGRDAGRGDTGSCHRRLGGGGGRYPLPGLRDDDAGRARLCPARGGRGMGRPGRVRRSSPRPGRLRRHRQPSPGPCAARRRQGRGERRIGPSRP